MTLTATALRRSLKEALEVAEAGGTVLLTRHGKVVAALVSSVDAVNLKAMKEIKKRLDENVKAIADTVGPFPNIDPDIERDLKEAEDLQSRCEALGMEVPSGAPLSTEETIEKVEELIQALKEYHRPSSTVEVEFNEPIHLLTSEELNLAETQSPVTKKAIQFDSDPE